MSLNSSFSQTDECFLPLNPEVGAGGQTGPRHRQDLSLSSGSSSLNSIASLHLQAATSQPPSYGGSYHQYQYPGPGPGPNSPPYLPPHPQLQPQPQPQYNYYPPPPQQQQVLPPHLTRVHYTTG